MIHEEKRQIKQSVTIADWIIIVYSLLFQFISWIVGLVGVAVFKLPKWIV